MQFSFLFYTHFVIAVASSLSLLSGFDDFLVRYHFPLKKNEREICDLAIKRGEQPAEVLQSLI